MAPGAQVRFDSGADPAAAAALAKESQVAIIFAYQWTHEAHDLPNLTLPDNQDELIDKVVAANANTIVVLETGTAATMPWADRVSGILEAWYAGSKGADAVANIIFGEVNPSAKLPITFPVSEADLPHPILVGPSPEEGAPGANMRTGVARPTFKVHYDEGLKVGYKWFDAENKQVLFPFGFGLSYTTYNYSDLEVLPDSPTGGSVTTVSFQVRNTGSRAGVEIAQVYVSLPASAGEPPERLVGWSRVALEPWRDQEGEGNRRFAKYPVGLRRSHKRLEADPRRLHFSRRQLLTGSGTDNNNGVALSQILRRPARVSICRKFSRTPPACRYSSQVWCWARRNPALE
jgi:beta-glucosidase